MLPDTQPFQYTSQNGVVLVSSEDIPRTQKQRKKNWKCIFPNCNEPVKTRFNCYAHVWDAHIRQYYTQTFPDIYPTTPFKKTPDKTQMKNLCEKYMVQLVEKPNPKSKKESPGNSSPVSDVKLKTDSTDEISIDLQNLHPSSPVLHNESSSNVKSENSSPLNQSNEQPVGDFTQSNHNYPFAFLTGSKIQKFGTFSNYQPTQESFESPVYFDQTINQPIQNDLHQQPTYNFDFQNKPVYEQQQGDTAVCWQPPQDINNQDIVKIEQITSELRRLHVFGEIFAENGYLVRSDARCKTDITTIENALNSVTSLIGRKYSYKNNETQTKYGFIAQEVEEILPGLVQTDDGGNLSVDVLGVVPYIVEALKTIHQNSTELKTNSQQEFEELSKIVEDAVKSLNVLMRQNNMKETPPITTKRFSLDIFGPPIFVLLMSIFFTVMALVLPFFIPYLFFVLGYFVIVSIILWTIVIAQKKKLVLFFVSRKQIYKWRHLHFSTWFLVLSGILISLTLSLLLGFGGLVMSSAYIVFGGLLAIALYLLHVHPSTKFAFKWCSIIFTLFYIGSFILLILFSIFQPFVSFNVENYEDTVGVKLYPQKSVTPLVLTSPPWNCFNAKIYTDNDLPSNLTIVMPQESTTQDSSPVIRGIVSSDITTTSVEISIECCGIIRQKYDKVTFRTCESKTDMSQCLENGCSWCPEQSTCGFCGDTSFCSDGLPNGCS
ncbi:Peptidase S74 domain-containing protein [Entamoeba marina]